MLDRNQNLLNPNATAAITLIRSTSAVLRLLSMF
jgi:hypothetical protein